MWDRPEIAEIGWVYNWFELRALPLPPAIAWGKYGGEPHKVIALFAWSVGAEVSSSSPRTKAGLLRLYAGVVTQLAPWPGLDEGHELERFVPATLGPYVAMLTRFSRVTGLRLEVRPALLSNQGFVPTTVRASFVVGALVPMEL